MDIVKTKGSCMLLHGTLRVDGCVAAQSIGSGPCRGKPANAEPCQALCLSVISSFAFHLLCLMR